MKQRTYYWSGDRQNVAAAQNDNKKRDVVLNSFIQDVDIEFGETKITRIFKSKNKNIALATIISDKGRYLPYCLIPLVGYQILSLFQREWPFIRASIRIRTCWMQGQVNFWDNLESSKLSKYWSQLLKTVVKLKVGWVGYILMNQRIPFEPDQDA